MRASSQTLEVGATQNLFSSQVAIRTKPFIAGADLKQYEVCFFDGSVVKPLRTGANNTSDQIVIATSDALYGQSVGCYTSGDFNHAALVWGDDLTTFEQRESAIFNGKRGIEIHKIPL